MTEIQETIANLQGKVKKEVEEARKKREIEREEEQQPQRIQQGTARRPAQLCGDRRAGAWLDVQDRGGERRVERRTGHAGQRLRRWFNRGGVSRPSSAPAEG